MVLGATFVTILCFVLVVSLFEKAPTQRAGMLSSVPQLKNVLMCLTEKIGALGKLCSRVNVSSVSHEFHVNESTLYIK